MTDSAVTILLLDEDNPDYHASLCSEWQSKWSNASINIKFAHLQIEDTIRVWKEEEKPQAYEKLRQAEKEHGPIVGLSEYPGQIQHDRNYFLTLDLLH